MEFRRSVRYAAKIDDPAAAGHDWRCVVLTASADRGDKDIAFSIEDVTSHRSPGTRVLHSHVLFATHAFHGRYSGPFQGDPLRLSAEIDVLLMSDSNSLASSVLWRHVVEPSCTGARPRWARLIPRTYAGWREVVERSRLAVVREVMET